MRLNTIITKLRCCENCVFYNKEGLYTTCKIYGSALEARVNELKCTIYGDSFKKCLPSVNNYLVTERVIITLRDLRLVYFVTSINPVK